MSRDHQNLTVTQGDRLTVRITVAPATVFDTVNLAAAGVGVRWAPDLAEGATTPLTKTLAAGTVTVVDASTLQFVLTEAETAALPPGEHTHACAVYLPGKHTVTRGRLTVRPTAVPG